MFSINPLEHPVYNLDKLHIQGNIIHSNYIDDSKHKHTKYLVTETLYKHTIFPPSIDVTSQTLLKGYKHEHK